MALSQLWFVAGAVVDNLAAGQEHAMRHRCLKPAGGYALELGKHVSWLRKRHTHTGMTNELIEWPHSHNVILIKRSSDAVPSAGAPG